MTDVETDVGMDIRETIGKFVDHLAPKLDTYEHVIYVYILRHTVLVGQNDAVIPFRSAREKMSLGSGQKGRPMSEATCREKLQSLASKGAVEVLRTEHGGTRVRIVLPDDIPGVVPPREAVAEPLPIEDMDFFEVEENRLLILEREGGCCFYTLEELDSQNFVIDHVVSRPKGGNGYKNIVACSRQANNRKGSMDAADFLFQLHHRGGALDFEQLRERLERLEDLKAGRLRPKLRPSH